MATHMEDQMGSSLMAVANALVKLHKEQFGRGPTAARAAFAGPDALICVLDDVMLPAERKMVELGQADDVRQTRLRFQVATAPEFVATIEEIVGRKVRAFASSVDPEADVVFENFAFEPRHPGVDGDGDGAVVQGR